METPKVSIIASSARCWLWPEFMESLAQNTIVPQVTFAGPLDRYQVRYFVNKYQNLQYVHTPVKPAQCYQLAFLYSDFDSLIMYVADDCEFEPGLIDKVVEFYQNLNNPKAVVSIRTNEDGRNYGTEIHTLLGWNVNTPLMAPIGLVSQRYLATLGGFDRRFISGQWENDFCMRVYADGGDVVAYDPGPTVFINHQQKHKTQNNPFWSAYQHDRKVLEDTWVEGGYKPSTPYVTVRFKDGREVPMFKILDNRKVVKKPLLPFEPYEDEKLIEQNQGPFGIFEVKAETPEPVKPAEKSVLEVPNVQFNTTGDAAAPAAS